MRRRRRYGRPTYNPPSYTPASLDATAGEGQETMAAYRPPVTRQTTNPTPCHILPRTWGDMLAEADAGVPDPTLSREWAGVATYAEALHLARYGWPEGAAAVRALALPTVRALVSARVPTGGWSWDVAGADYDVSEYLSGTPECWLTPETEQSKPVIRVAMNITTAASISTETITARGAAVVALVLALQAAGYVVDLAAYVGTAPDYQQTGWLRAPLVDAAGGPLDTDRMLFALAHPAFARAIAFAVLDHHILGKRHRTWGGWAQTPPPGTCDVWVGEWSLRSTNWQSPDAARAWVEAQFTRITTR